MLLARSPKSTAARRKAKDDRLHLLVLDEYQKQDGWRIIGRTTLQEQGPPWGWTDQQKAEPALYMTTSVTDPAFRDLRRGR